MTFDEDRCGPIEESVEGDAEDVVSPDDPDRRITADGSLGGRLSQTQHAFEIRDGVVLIGSPAEFGTLGRREPGRCVFSGQYGLRR